MMCAPAFDRYKANDDQRLVQAKKARWSRLSPENSAR